MPCCIFCAILKFMLCVVFVGIPLMEELISIYCHRRGIDPNLPNWNFFMALSFFKLAGISQVIILSKCFTISYYCEQCFLVQVLLFWFLGHWALAKDKSQIWVTYKFRIYIKDFNGKKIWGSHGLLLFVWQTRRTVREDNNDKAGRSMREKRPLWVPGAKAS